MKSLKTILAIALFSASSVTLQAGFTDKDAPATYKIAPEKSAVKWNGKKVTGEHFGSIRISEGSFDYDGKLITAGTVTIDMNSLTVEDVKDEKGNARLTAHLKNDDFFATDKFPHAKLVVTGSSAGANGQLNVTGNLTIKGITKPITFPVTVKSQGNTTETTGVITVDRAKYDIQFRSKSFMDPASLGDRLIYDDFTLDIKVVASK